MATGNRTQGIEEIDSGSTRPAGMMQGIGKNDTANPEVGELDPEAKRKAIFFWKLWLLVVPAGCEKPQPLMQSMHLEHANMFKEGNAFKRVYRMELIFSFAIPTVERYTLSSSSSLI